MNNGVVGVLKESKRIKDIKQNFSKNLNTQLSINLSASHRAFVMANLYEELKGKKLLITYNWQRANDLYEELLRLLPEDEIFLFPQLDILPHERIETDISVKIQRLTVLENLKTMSDLIVIVPIQALLQGLTPKEIFFDYHFEINIDDNIDLKEFGKQLIEQGYERVDMVENKGDFSIRGGIIDIYPLTKDNPVRIELFGDEIESIREFDLATQRSIKDLSNVSLPPATEILLSSMTLDEGIKSIRELLTATKEEILGKENENEASELEKRIEGDIEKLREGIIFPGIEQYLPSIYREMSTLIDYFQEGDLIFDAPNRIRAKAFNIIDDLNELKLSLLKQGSILKNYEENFVPFEELLSDIYNYSKLYLSTASKIKGLKVDKELELNIEKPQVFHGQVSQFIDRVKELKDDRFKVLITLSTKSKCKRLVDALKEEGLPAFYVTKVSDQIKPGNIVVTTDTLQEGIILPAIKFILFAENNIFKQTKRKRKRKVKAYDQGVKISSFEELNVNDYVVHENHGIGKYLGVKTLEVQGHSQDYLLINYADEDKLYVPTEQVDLIQKYVGTKGEKPKLYSLGSNDWSRVKKRVQESVQEMAEGLLELYAEREVANGYAFSEDTVWQKEFEADFPYEETADQLKAIQEVKEDMESPQPMDRLLCGDVGYGKTEVAIRAAFKAVMDGKQVAMLVPTTILAQQHLNTFVERFEDYPVNVDMLSRFRTPKEQKEVVKNLKRGLVDVIIGTHRILSSDIEFKDLGLLIVDEEQRFGVKHKEKLKDIKRSVDVLTLTATPIPRTLHMSLVGVRDMSLIETPPENRYPIRTYVRGYSPNLVRESIQRELNRGGQVYFVHNRVADIDKVASRIKKLVPEVKLAVAHGQMSESQLEKIMLAFLEGEYDLLVCTTIIETGLDISNVNTIIINNADKMGLSQLYQLRGRVGRTNRVAYAYLLYKSDQILSEVAEKRLQAIKEFTNLGSGFKIAMRDLEIRGAGNILGPDQHGHIEAIGFSLYCKLLEQAIKQLKGKSEEESVEVNIDLDIDAYIAEAYIPDSKQKIEIYKKISGIMELEDVADIKDELVDRFGAIPQPVLNLIKIGKIKVLALDLDVGSIKSEGEAIVVKFNSADYLLGEQVIELSRKYEGQIRFRATKEPILKLKVVKDETKNLDTLIDILNFLNNTQNSK